MAKKLGETLQLLKDTIKGIGGDSMLRVSLNTSSGLIAKANKLSDLTSFQKRDTSLAARMVYAHLIKDFVPYDFDRDEGYGMYKRSKKSKEDAEFLKDKVYTNRLKYLKKKSGRNNYKASQKFADENFKKYWNTEGTITSKAKGTHRYKVEGGENAPHLADDIEVNSSSIKWKRPYAAAVNDYDDRYSGINWQQGNGQYMNVVRRSHWNERAIKNKKFMSMYKKMLKEIYKDAIADDITASESAAKLGFDLE